MSRPVKVHGKTASCKDDRVLRQKPTMGEPYQCCGRACRSWVPQPSIAWVIHDDGHILGLENVIAVADDIASAIPGDVPDAVNHLPLRRVVCFSICQSQHTIEGGKAHCGASSWIRFC